MSLMGSGCQNATPGSQAVNGSVFVEDLNSSNGTSVNGVACPPFQPVQIRPGDMVDVGGIALRVSA